MRWLITGGAGFIGSHLVDRLLADGHEVVVVDNFSTGQRSNLRADNRLAIIESDVCHGFGGPFFSVMRFDHIVHLAATVGVENVMRNPVRTLFNNTEGARRVLDLARHPPTSVFIASTSEVYGLTNEFPCSEDQPLAIGDPTKVRWGYAASKLADECLAMAYHVEYGLPVRIGRFFNTVGPRQSDAYGMVIPRFVKQALAGAPLTIYGDGTQTRTFCHVHDTVDAIVRLCMAPNTAGQIYNIGSPQETSISFLAKEISKLVSLGGVKHVPQPYGDRFEDMPRRVPGIAKIQNAIDWYPTHSLADIIDDVIAEQRNAPR